MFTAKVRETEWAISIHSSDIKTIETGDIYIWKTHPALRLRYKDKNNNARTLILNFKSPAAQAGCIKLLRDLNFRV
jgi:hypothetical protein